MRFFESHIVSHKRIFSYAILAALISIVFFMQASRPAEALTTVPTKMNFQGRLTDSSGNIMPNGTYNMRFRLYTVLTGGSTVWSEDRLVSGGTGVTLTDGLFSVQLGSVTSLAASLFASGALYFEVELPTPATATSSSPSWTEGPMTPRNQLATSAYSYNSETLDGLDSTAFAQLGSASNFTGALGATLNSTTAFKVANGSSIPLFNVDTSGGSVVIGQVDSTAIPLVLDTKNTTGDPVTAVPGSMYYNSNTNKFRCYQASAWVDCIGAGGAASTMQDVYNNSSSPATITTTASKGITVAAGAAPTSDLFTIDNSSFANVTSGVNGLAINYKGGAGAIEASAGRIDLTPGTTSGATWNGLKIVANTTGATTGVTEYGINLDGPTSPGAGTEVAVSIDANWDAGLQLGSKTGEPSTPPADNIYVYASKYAGRSLLSQKSPSGVSFPYQPAIFSNTTTQFSPNSGTTGSYLGGAWTIVATASTPTVSTEALGFGTNFATTAVAGNTSGAYQTATQFFRGSVTSGANGFFNVNRIVIPDASYGSGATGARMWTGMTSTTSTVMVGADNPAGSYAGFMYSTNRGDTNWQFITKDGTTQNVINTGLPFTPVKVYDFYVYVQPLGGTIYWRVDNLNDGTSQEGNTATNLPPTTTNLRDAIGIATLTTTARNIRINKAYVESDR